MIYVFDTTSFSEMSAFFPSVFVKFWREFDLAAEKGIVASTREVLTEIEKSPHEEVIKWAKVNKHLFPTPDGMEANFVAQIFQIEKFRENIGKKEI